MSTVARQEGIYSIVSESLKLAFYVRILTLESTICLTLRQPQLPTT